MSAVQGLANSALPPPYIQHSYTIKQPKPENHNQYQKPEVQKTNKSVNKIYTHQLHLDDCLVRYRRGLICLYNYFQDVLKSVCPCDEGAVETELHFLARCPKYSAVPKQLLN